MSSPFILSQQSIGIIVVVVTLITAIYYLAIFFYWLTQKFKHEGTTKKVDPFLRIYILITILFTILLWEIMGTNSGDIQRQFVLIMFMVTAIVTIIAVLWRAQIIKKFNATPNTLKKPPSLLTKPYVYWPYFLVLGFAGFLNINIILAYTTFAKNAGNRIIILKYFFLLTGFLILCRVLSRCIDSVVIRNYEKKKIIIAKNLFSCAKYLGMKKGSTNNFDDFLHVIVDASALSILVVFSEESWNLSRTFLQKINVLTSFTRSF